jgi:hypothetical protein
MEREERELMEREEGLALTHIMNNQSVCYKSY